MVESEKSASLNYDVSLLLARLHDGGDFSIFDDLVLKGQFDQTWSNGENDRDVSDYVKNVQENMVSFFPKRITTILKNLSDHFFADENRFDPSSDPNRRHTSGEEFDR